MSGTVGAEQVICSNCGGLFQADAARCPYCGALNPGGAEKAYLDALEDLRDETDMLDDYVWATSAAIRLAQLDAEGKLQANALASDEQARLAGHRASALQFLQDLLQMNAEEVEAFAISVEDEQGNVMRGKVKESLELRLGRLGTVG